MLKYKLSKKQLKSIADGTVLSICIPVPDNSPDPYTYFCEALDVPEHWIGNVMELEATCDPRNVGGGSGLPAIVGQLLHGEPISRALTIQVMVYKGIVCDDPAAGAKPRPWAWAGGEIMVPMFNQSPETRRE